jgi:RimJ/RimL family protein N-acetyltransferase
MCMLSSINIQPLSQQKLSEAQRLVDETFPYCPWLTRRLFFSVSDPQIVYRWVLLIGWQVTSLGNWVALDINTDRVIGTVGIYTYRKDEKEAYWLSWFCVNPNFRGRGIGKELLQFAIHSARQPRKRFLRLYTSTHPSEVNAQHLYEKLGFQITGKELWKGTPYERIYRELEL